MIVIAISKTEKNAVSKFSDFLIEFHLGLKFLKNVYDS